MGDEVIIKKIEVIQGGLFQIDTQNLKDNKCQRIFIDPYKLFTMIGQAMQNNHIDYLNKNKYEGDVL